MLKSSLCDYSDANIFVKGNITIIGAEGEEYAAEKTDNKRTTQKNPL